MEAALIAILGASLLIALFLFSLLQGEKSQFRKYAQEQSRMLCDLQEKHDKEMQKTMAVWQQKIEQQHYNMMDEIDKANERVKHMQSKVKSEQVRIGHLMEKLSPILGTFPVDPRSNDIIPCTGPVDYIGFVTDKEDDKNGVFLIEVKSGGSQLSQKQKKIRALVEEKKVYFLTYHPDNSKES